MFKLVKTSTFETWLKKLPGNARGRVESRLDRLGLGNPGDVKPVGSGVSEMRIDYGPGYRVYFFRRGLEVIVLLAGGDKRSQKRDIALAIELKEIVKDMPCPE
ncbi:MAG TPA: type II toxin-antitoxin system RelE/ParE family toxin [Rhizomicrobium sp.]|nr:type II toxin-antitoxin system RelE/ParE family toxin [Rhizomicrobium sp.]